MQKLSSICKGRKNTASPFSGDARVSVLAQDFLLGINDINPLSPQKPPYGHQLDENKSNLDQCIDLF